MSRTAIVTGANRGLGLAFVRQLLARGEQLVAGCRHPGKATALNTLAGEYPGRLHVLPLDVGEARSRAQFVRELPLALGDEARIDLLLNNAGVLHPGERFGQLGQAILEDSLRINAVGPFLLAEALAPRLAEGAKVANLSSVMGSIGNCREFRSPSYCASKAAQNMLNVQLARALAPRGIVVLTLHPGWVRTDMGGEAAEIAPDEAVAGLLRVIDAAQPAQSGQFLDWRGQHVPW